MELMYRFVYLSVEGWKDSKWNKNEKGRNSLASRRGHARGNKVLINLIFITLNQYYIT